MPFCRANRSVSQLVRQVGEGYARRQELSCVGVSEILELDGSDVCPLDNAPPLAGIEVVWIYGADGKVIFPAPYDAAKLRPECPP